jgi:hypothetical protein
MTCPCHDPVVFGHHHEPPPLTYRAGETFTAGQAEVWIRVNEGQPIHFGITTHLVTNTTTVTNPTPWNWIELAQTARNRAEPGETRP